MQLPPQGEYGHSWHGSPSRLMNAGMRRFAVMLGVFVLAFLAVFVLRKAQGGGGHYS